MKDDISVIATKFQHAHGRLLLARERAKHALEAFKHEHGLNQRYQAYYPESKALPLSLLCAALLIEALANAWYFPQNFGLLGGALIALSVSMANVGVSFFAGLAILRQMHHRERLRKWIGVIGFLLILTLLAVLHLSVAHYREALARNPDAEILTSLAFDPRTLQDMESLILIIIGGMISVFAMWKGYIFDDPYPGFGRVFRTWKDLDDAASELEKTFKLEVNSAYNRAVTDVHAIPIKLNERESQLKKLDGEIGTYFACVDAYYHQAKLAALQLITSFRCTVQSVWTNPNCFLVHQALVDSQLTLLDPKELEGEARAQMREKIDCLGRSRDTCKASKNEVIKRLKDECDETISESIDGAKPVPKIPLGTDQSQLPHIVKVQR